MNRIYLLPIALIVLLNILFAFTGYSQAPDWSNGVKWTYKEVYDNGDTSYIQYKSLRDTFIPPEGIWFIIEEKSLTINLWGDTTIFSTPFYYIMKYDSDREMSSIDIYNEEARTGTNLYNFTIPENQGHASYCPINGQIVASLVEDVDTINHLGIDLRQLSLSTTQVANCNLSSVVLEQVGNLQTMFPTYALSTPPTSAYLVCFEEGDYFEYPKGCNRIVTSIEEKLKEEPSNDYSFIPNPTTGKSLIVKQNTSWVKPYEIYSPLGKLLHVETFNLINLSNYPNGLYYIRIEGKIYKLVKYE